jgi:hypothetical protein
LFEPNSIRHLLNASFEALHQFQHEIWSIVIATGLRDFQTEDANFLAAYKSCVAYTAHRTGVQCRL